MNNKKPYPKQRLMFMDVEPCDYPAIVITAHQVLDGAGVVVWRGHGKTEAAQIAARFKAAYPDRNFYAE